VLMLGRLVNNKLEGGRYGTILGTTRCTRIMLPHCTSLSDTVHHDINGRHFEHNGVGIVTGYRLDNRGVRV
jgi:hypothetical protein